MIRPSFHLYASLVAEQRRKGYPLRLFVTVRPPTLPFLLATLSGEGARRLVFQVLAPMSIATLARRAWPADAYGRPAAAQ
jgi:hypothetical protein